MLSSSHIEYEAWMGDLRKLKFSLDDGAVSQRESSYDLIFY
jgi:hypothetical protein